MSSSTALPRSWDIFCQVIDNFGDVGVCWRLACALAKRGQQVRLWLDDDSALAWMAPDGQLGVNILPWQPGQPQPADYSPADVVIEAFGCEIDHHWIATHSIALQAYFLTANPSKDSQNTPPTPVQASPELKRQPIWLNLEYLSAERYVARSHGLRSPILAGPAQGLHKWFFYPGFTAQTGGLIRPELSKEAAQPPQETQKLRISLFCYEPPALGQLLQQLQQLQQLSPSEAAACELLVTAGRAQRAVAGLLPKSAPTSPHSHLKDQNRQSLAENLDSLLLISYLPLMAQPAYEALLRRCDLNFVRGEDSLVQALWAGRAFVWQIYPQNDGAHEAKLEAFLDWLQAPPDLRLFHRIWNGLQTGKLPPIQPQSWAECCQAARGRLLTQTDLITQLIDFVEEKSQAAP